MNKKSSLHTTGLKITPGREAVMNLLEKRGCLSAREIWQEVLKDNPQVGFATVYRTLSTLCEAGLARKIPANKGAVYEGIQDDTAPQLVCSRCGKVEDIKDPALLRYNADIMRTRGLTDDNALLLYADCKRKECAVKE